ncbi:MAG TPA: metallopeptidase family protein [Candidatus Methylomirabilis sp.]|nr:metallopeptidase family protein [Candidatus Methylomirabilis sp.]
MVRLSRTEFEKLVARAVEGLPPRFLARLQNVEVVVESQPTEEERQRAGIEPGSTLLGLYQGIPQTQRGSWYGSVLPDRIVIYQRPIEALAGTLREIRRQVRITLMHEIGHHFGLDEDELSEAGYE